jgi:hypothetical protein
VNGDPSQDIRIFGDPCPASGAGSGGLVYLDNYDPVAGTGDVTVLSSAAGSRPRVIGKNGGTGGIYPGSTGARIQRDGSRLLTLANVDVVTGALVKMELPDGPVTTLAQNVRVENYDFLPDGGILYVGNYARNIAAAEYSTGDIVRWDDGARSTLAAEVNRFDFFMYRLSPDALRIAYVKNLDVSGGDLYVQPVAAGSTAVLVDTRVESMAFASDGSLVYWQNDTDGTSYHLWVVPAAATSPNQSVSIASQVNSVAVEGSTIVYQAGWDLLDRTEELWQATTAGGAGVQLAARAADPIAVFLGGGGGGALVFTDGYDPDRGTADLRWTPLGAGGGTTLDDVGMTPEGGLHFSPQGGWLAYTMGYTDPVTVSDPLPQPGIAAQLEVTNLSTGARFLLGSQASIQRVAWASDDSAVAAVADLDLTTNSGRLVVAPTSGGGTWLEADRVGALAFAFGEPGYGAGRSIAALRAWNDALQRGELILAPVAAQASPQAVDEDVTFFLPPRGGRILYAVRGGGRDGIWLYAAP